jgi:hypothetical protein
VKKGGSKFMLKGGGSHCKYSNILFDGGPIFLGFQICSKYKSRKVRDIDISSDVVDL